MTSFEQIHSGGGDNVAGDKIFIQIKSLAPSDFGPAIELVFESIRRKDTSTATAQLAMLRVMAQRDQDTAGLVEVISIMSGLVETENRDVAWKKVANIISRGDNDIVRDISLAALLKLANGTERAATAKELYEQEDEPQAYSREMYFRLYAECDELEEAGRSFVSEGEMVGIVEGAFRHHATDLFIRMARTQYALYPSLNSEVVLAVATGLELNPELAQCHFWLVSPAIKDRIDDWSENVIRLLDASKGRDKRIQDLICALVEIHSGNAPTPLIDAIRKYRHEFDPARSPNIAKIRALVSDETELDSYHRDLLAAHRDSESRAAWCRSFLERNTHTIEEIGRFLRLASSSDIEVWLARDHVLENATQVEEDFVRLGGRIFQSKEGSWGKAERRELAAHVDSFIAAWSDDIHTFNPTAVLELSERLMTCGLPDRALELTSRMIPSGPLWASPFVVAHLNCLLSAEQHETFERTLALVKDADKSALIVSLHSTSVEKQGQIKFAVDLMDQALELAPTAAYLWYRACYLRHRYLGITEQQTFNARVPDAILQTPTREVLAIIWFLTRSGAFKRVEPIWVQWFIKAPNEHAVDLVNFHFGAGRSVKFDVSPTLDGFDFAVEYEQDGDTQVRLVIKDDQDAGEYTLRSSSQLARALRDLEIGETASIGVVSYKLKERLPPYIACLRIALRLRHIQNDGSDCFAMMRIPEDPEALIPYLEEKLAQESEDRKRLYETDAIPLYMRGHALSPHNVFKGALSCWTDIKFPKSAHWGQGATDGTMVLDAYGIAYLATTDLAEKLLEIGVSFVLPPATKEALDHFIDEISDDDFMQMGVTEGGKLFRTTASDLRTHLAHVLEALKLIRSKASIIHPNVHDAQLDLYSIKDAIDATAYDAIQLSIANNIPWFCMDAAFASLHHSKGYPTANIEAVILRAVSSGAFHFHRIRHSFLLFSVGALPLPFTRTAVYALAATPNSLASWILYKIIKNHGSKIFAIQQGRCFLLDIILLQVLNRSAYLDNLYVMLPSYSPREHFADHVFNYGLSLFLSLTDGKAEFKLASAMMYMLASVRSEEIFFRLLTRRFWEFSQGHFLNWSLVENHLGSLRAKGLIPNFDGDDD